MRIVELVSPWIQSFVFRSWLHYKRELDERRAVDKQLFQKGLPPLTKQYPKHPSKLVEEVEKQVDAEMRRLYPDYVR